DLVSLFEEPPRVPRLEVEVVVLDPGTHLDFLQVDLMLLLASFPGLALLLVLELAVVHDPADRGPGHGSNLDEVETELFRSFEGILYGQEPLLLAVRIDDSHWADPDLLIDTRSLVDGSGSPSEGNRKRRTRIRESVLSGPARHPPARDRWGPGGIGRAGALRSRKVRGRAPTCRKVVAEM